MGRVRRCWKMKVGVYVGEKKIDEVSICEDYEEAWEHVY